MKKIRDILQLAHTEGDVGVEIEVEGANLPKAPKGWRGDVDGSLRGECLEYVLAKPVEMKALNKSLKDLKEAFVANKSVFDESYRAGVHVHVNVQDLTPMQLANMVTLYYLFENNIISTCRKDRQSNHFCLKATQAEGSFRTIRNVFMSSKFNNLAHDRGDMIRYSAINYKCLLNYGSLEFRSMESTADFDKIHRFADMHVRLREFGKAFENPMGVIAWADGHSPVEITREVFGDLSGDLLKNPKFFDDFEDGLELAEDLAYCKTWGIKSLDIFSPVENIF